MGRKDLGDSVSRGWPGRWGRGLGAGVPGPGDAESRGAGEAQRGSGDALVIVCVRGAGAGRIRGEVGLRRNCELGSPGCESWSYGVRERNP